MGAPLRLTPTMRSRKLIALDFIKRYFAEWGHSPTYSEVAAELGVSKKRAHELVQQLSDERQLEVVGGRTRGIRLLDRAEELSEADILVRLRALGWSVAGDRMAMTPPLTEKGLMGLPELDHE